LNNDGFSEDSIEDILKEYLDDLDIDYFMVRSLSGSEMYSGYIVIYIDTDDFSRSILEKLGFQKIEEDLYFISAADAYDYINSRKLKSIIFENSMGIKECHRNDNFLKERIEIAELWDSLCKLILEINEIYYEKYRCYFYDFKNLRMIYEAFTMKSFVTDNYDDLHRFVGVLHYLLHDSIGYNKKCSEKLCDLWREQVDDDVPEDKVKCINEFSEKFLGGSEIMECLKSARNYFSHNYVDKKIEFESCLAKLINAHSIIEYDFIFLRKRC